MNKILSLSLVLIVGIFLFGCGGGDTSTTGGGSTATPTPTPGPTPTPTPVACNTVGGGFDVASEGFYVQNATATISSVTLQFMASANNGTKNLTMTARGCSFGGTTIGTATASPNIAMPYNYYSVTFTFGTPIPLQNCSGAGTVAFTVANASGGVVYFGGQHLSGSACTIPISGNISSTPTARAGDWAVTGSFVSP